MSKYQTFIFENYQFDVANKTLDLHYGLDGALHFTETYRFNFDFADYHPAVLDRALQALFLMAGVSYYKTYVPPEIIIKNAELSEADAAFFGKTYQRGLGEFWYVNGLDPRTPVTFPATLSHNEPLRSPAGDGLLIGVGGGKDSLATIEMLRDQIDGITTWSLDHETQLRPLIEQIGLPHVWVERTWDRQLLELNQQDALNGHVPISAIFACVGVVTAILSGKRDVVVSNEQAANEPTLHYQGVAINHQYSKSQEFEQDFQNYLQNNFGETVRYYSFMRALSELYIAELFARIGFDKYVGVFSSCNRAYVHSSDHMFWCGECPKCAYVFMALTPFIASEKLKAVWSGKNLLEDPSLEPLYRQLLGIEGDKPLECVGEIKENRAAMRLASRVYPELTDKYQFELPDDYNYRAVMSDEMPPDIKQLFSTTLAKLQS